MSRVRVGYLKKDRVAKKPLILDQSLVSESHPLMEQLQLQSIQVGGEDKLTRLLNEYEFSLQNLTHNQNQKGGYKARRKTHKKNKLHRAKTLRKKH
jgi:hypothetical protein